MQGMCPVPACVGAGFEIQSGMPDDPQMILAGVATACLVPALLAAAWSLALGYLGASRGFVPASLEDVGSHARNNRRWWDHLGG